MRITDEELSGRRKLGVRWKRAIRQAAIEDEIRGIRLAINILIEREKALQQEKEKLHPVRQQSGRGGA